ncbi:hypothetical protein [Pontibacter russatus]|uniref:hypothetical protein n=1 Tax=Pontibacter russatus TaxID=2694929 RepID=UPI00137AFC73|nr:hypothetical protein [Pontibacter russatus]
MADRPMNPERNEGENHEIGRELYNRDRQQNQGSSRRYGYRGDNDRKWDEGNFFHTGPSPRGAQDREHTGPSGNEYRRGGSSHSSYNQGQNAHLSDHYGSRSDSTYRNERSYIDHGNHGSGHFQHDERHSMHRPHTPGGSLQGNYDDLNSYQNDPWREGPGSGSRYKESDYRYGSGSHNWYRENRYTPDHRSHVQGEGRGIMDRVKDTWNDIWHSDDKDYQPRHRHQSNADRLDTRTRYSSDAYRDRNFDRGYEGGPRWADESDRGHDSRDSDRTSRYRR